MTDDLTTQAKLREQLSKVADPEIPVLDIVEMGIVRDARMEHDTLVVEITPTYSGCPAMRAIENEIVATMKAEGYEQVRVDTVFSEPWTTDWMTEEARRKLREYGIAPPPYSARLTEEDSVDVAVACPHCHSDNTVVKSFFGSTACKALHYCNACDQPFEAFKCI
jgi:ring-1,2-phenylacetyl-CoA epoxidase subunit PaaD